MSFALCGGLHESSRTTSAATVAEELERRQHLRRSTLQRARGLAIDPHHARRLAATRVSRAAAASPGPASARAWAPRLLYCEHREGAPRGLTHEATRRGHVDVDMCPHHILLQIWAGGEGGVEVRRR